MSFEASWLIAWAPALLSAFAMHRFCKDARPLDQIRMSGAVFIGVFALTITVCRMIGAGDGP